MAAINQGKPVTSVAPRAPISTSFEGLASSIAERQEAVEMETRSAVKGFFKTKKKPKKIAWQT